MKLQKTILLAFIGISALNTCPIKAQNSSPIYENTDNPVVICNATTDNCWGPPQESWKWDCYQACLKAGDVFKDMTETNCNGEKQSAYNVMSDGKPLMILWEGWDCGNCMAKGPNVSDYIIANKDKMHFWFAFGGIGGGAKCGAASDNHAIASWVKSYSGFQYAHGFLDNDFSYIYGVHSLPHYTLVDPRTKKVVLISHQNEGNDPWGRMVTASNNLLKVVTNIEDQDILASIELFPNPVIDILNVKTAGVIKGDISIQILNSLGLEVLTSSNLNSIDVRSISTGLYIVKVFNDGVCIKTDKLIKE